MDRVSSNIIINDFNKEKEKAMKKTVAKKITLNTAKIERISNVIDYEWMGSINKQEAIKRITEILQKKHHIIELGKEMSYRCVDSEEGYILQYKWWQDDEWYDVTDLSEMRIWEYNDLVDKLNKHYPDYPIEHLEGRFV